MLPVKLFWARAGLGAATPPPKESLNTRASVDVSDCERRRGFLPPARGRQLKCLRVSSRNAYGFLRAECLQVRTRMPARRSRPPPSPEALRSTVDSGRAGRAGAEISPRPRRRGRPAGVAIPPPESNFPPGGAPGRGLSSAPGRGLSSAGAPGRGLSVCPRIPGHGTRIPNPGARSQAAATIPYSMAYLVPSPHRTTAYSTYYGHASVAHHRMYHRQHHRQQSAPSSPTSPSFRSHFGASTLAPVRLTAYCARGRAARAPAARAHSVETATTRKRLD